MLPVESGCHVKRAFIVRWWVNVNAKHAKIYDMKQHAAACNSVSSVSSASIDRRAPFCLVPHMHVLDFVDTPV